MKNLRVIVTFFLAVAVFSAAFGQSDPKADKILKESQSKFKTVKNFTASFTYTLNNPNLDKPIVKKGAAQIEGKKYHIAFPDEEFFCNGEKVWVFLAEEEEVTITSYDPEESMSVDMIYKNFEKDIRTRYDGDMGTKHKITAFMLDEKSDIWKSEIWITKSTKMVEKAVMYGRNGSTYTYSLSNLKMNQSIPASTFVFDMSKHPDVYVNDLVD